MSDREREQERKKDLVSGGKEGSRGGNEGDDGRGESERGSKAASGKGFSFGKMPAKVRSSDCGPIGSSSNLKSGAPSLPYRDKLLSPGCAGFLVQHAEEDDIVRGWKEYFHRMNVQDSQANLEETDEEANLATQRMEGKPGRLNFTAEEYTTWCLPWMNSLIIKVLGASFPT
ncbi:hypothetical protein K1719_017679 [Acacia pycnantha]|nr:hypothetical protein K1719_017679 [Acacia pycnantha]